MKIKCGVLLIIAACSSYVSTAQFVAIINNNGFSLESDIVTPPDDTIRCEPGTGITKSALMTMINSDLDVTNVCTGDITDFSYMFSNETSFNQNIGKWDVSNGINFNAMFKHASSFNQDIGKWDVSNGTSFMSMFHGALSFNKDIGKWNVSKSLSFNSMFIQTQSFEKDISGWDVSSGTDFNLMFKFSSGFNVDISGWNVQNSTSWNNFNSSSDLELSNIPLKFQ